ncbi:hypothetical protein [Lysinibacillus sp. NPDC096212]|uniref:hypothetical protein n=1 Tax=Lysinibacillus sp. NPDC096212 TaxID=3364135 RepID=UPI0038287234
MKKIVVWMLTFILIFSTLTISEAETSFDPENAVTEDDGQIELESKEESAPENNAQTESENKEEPPTTGGEQSESESNEEPPATGGEQTESENKEESAPENETDTESNGDKEPPATGEEQTESNNEENPAVECEEELAMDCEKPEESASEENLTVTLDNDGEYTDGGYRITGTLSKVSQPTILYYKIDDNDEKKIAEFENTDTDPTIPWEYTIPDDEVKKGLDHDITIYAENESGTKSNEETIKIRPALTITEQVFDEDDHEVEEVAPEKTVSYKIIVETDYIDEDTGTYGEVNITQQYATRLEQPADLKVIDEEGTEVGTASYNESANVIKATLDANLPRSTKVNITYNAKVKTDMEEEEYIISQATASGEYSTGDEANETSDKTKILITNARIKISDVGKIGNIDFSPLDKNDPVVGFKEMDKNSLLEFSKEKSSGRKYFMLFGDYNNDRFSNALEHGNVAFGDDAMRPLPSRDTTLEALMQSKNYIHAQNFAVMTLFPHSEYYGTATYYYENGKPSKNQVGNGLVIAQGNDENGKAEFQSTEMPILKLYKNEVTHELVAYAAVINGDFLDGYVKIKMSSVSESKGLVNISMKFLKLNDKYKYTNFAYNVRTDIGNLYSVSNYKAPINSLGNNKGFYFVVDENVNWAHRKDKHPYYLYFFRDGYANHPAELKVNDDPAHQPFSDAFYPTMSSLGSEDPGENAKYPSTQDPGWSLRWATDEQKYGEVREVNLELMVTDSNQHTIEQEVKLDNDIEYTDAGYRIKGTWNDDRGQHVTLYYTIDGGEPKKIEEYENKNPGTDVQWEHTILKDEMKKGLDHTITVYIKNESGFVSDEKTTKISPQFTITEQVFDKDGEVAERVAPEGTVNYKIAVETNYSEEAGGTYGQVSITQKYATSLERPENLKVIDAGGKKVGTATYKDSANEIEITLDENLPRSTKINITYNAKVKKDMENEYIISQTTASGKYSTGDEINKTSVETKILINSTNLHTRMKISEVGKIGEIDFSMLDSPNELDGFTQMKINQGLKYKTKDPNYRDYYMYFGDIDSEKRYVSSLWDLSSYYKHNDDWNRPLPTMDNTLQQVVDSRFLASERMFIMAQNFQMITALENSCAYCAYSIVSYNYEKGRASNILSGTGVTIAHGDSADDTAKYQSTVMPLLKLFKNETTQELIGYGAVLNGEYVDGFIKIKMSSVSAKGRVNVSMKYLKLSDQHAFTNIAYSVHMDIVGQHKQSKMYSLGNYKGVFFQESGTTMADKKPFYLYFYRSGYANNPVALKASNFPTERPFDQDGSYYATLDSPGTPDSSFGGLMGAYQEHPGWAMRWEPERLDPYRIKEANVEIGITSKLDVMPIIELDNDGKYTDDGDYHISGIWSATDSEKIDLYYKIDSSDKINGSDAKLIREYKNTNPGSVTNWAYTIPRDQVKKGVDHNISVYVLDEDKKQSNIEMIKLRPTLTVTEQVFDEGGKEAEVVAPGETLSYSISVNPRYISDDKGKYDQVKITQTYNTNLEPLADKDIKVIDEDGNKVGTATFNESKKIIEASLNADADLVRSKKIYVTYNATVKEDAITGTITGQATVSGKYSTKEEFKGTSNEVRTEIAAVLKFDSAPKVIDFGEKLVISPRTKKYYPIKLDMPLAVKDTRTLSSKWTVMAKLAKPLIGTKPGGARLDGLRYRYGKKDSYLTEDISAEIYTKETTDGRRTVDISNTWSEDGDGLYLEVPAGKARADAFEGTITWMLQDVPTNE